MKGYSHPLYPQSFSDIGELLYLHQSEGWLIKRQIPGLNDYDAMGPYPLFFCENWEDLIDDLDNLEDELVSVSFVVGIFDNFPIKSFQNYFILCAPYKDLYYLDTSIPLEESISKWNRRDARRAFTQGGIFSPA